MLKVTLDEFQQVPPKTHHWKVILPFVKDPADGKPSAGDRGSLQAEGYVDDEETMFEQHEKAVKKLTQLAVQLTLSPHVESLIESRIEYLESLKNDIPLEEKFNLEVNSAVTELQMLLVVLRGEKSGDAYHTGISPRSCSEVIE